MYFFKCTFGKLNLPLCQTDVGSSFILSFQICFAHNLFYVQKIELHKCFLSA